MRQCVIEVHPWVEEHRFIEVHCVAQGTCAFPRYGGKILGDKYQCKFFRSWMVNDHHQERLREDFWAQDKQVAVPVAKDGRTM
jgi:hypothetical protein